MFRYFPSNYAWNLSVDLAIELGARTGEIEEMCAPLMEASKQSDEEGTRAFARSWIAMADKLCGLAAEDEQYGREISAGDKLQRAAIYYSTAERMQGVTTPGRKELYLKFQRTFLKGIAQSGANCERVEIPYGNTHIAGLYVRAEHAPGAAPILVQVN